jgi:hypothetical protein
MKVSILAALVFLCFSISSRSGFAQSGTITTYAGNGTFGFGGDDGLATSALLNYPSGVAVDAAGNIFIADTSNSRVRKVTPSGVIRTIAGNGTNDFRGDGGPATSAALLYPSGVAVDTVSNLFIADTSNSRIRKVASDGVIRTVAGNGTYGFGGDGGPATSASLNYPTSVAVDAAGNLFIADSYNNRVRKVTPDSVIRTVAGSGTNGFSGDGGPATSASLSYPTGVAVDAAGNLFIADTSNNRIRKVTPDGVIRTVAGGAFNFSGTISGDGGLATSASLFYPTSVAVDAAGNLFIADQYDQRIRKIIPSGLISTVAGNGTAGFSRDGVPATSASLNFPSGVAVDAAGNLFISNSDTEYVDGTSRIRKVERRARNDFNGGHDLNGDSRSDILWRDTAGNVSVWQLDGYSITANSFIANIWTGWTIAGTGDFNGDRKADILWRDTAGNVATWLMDGADVSSHSATGNMPASSKVAGVADFNGDGKSDILWRDSSGNVVMWLMNGHTIASSSFIANISTDWTIVGTGDFNGGGKADILWRDTAGNLAVWLMDGQTVSSYGRVVGNISTTLPLTWAVAGIADFDGDGAADILWRDTSGQVSIWLMNGSTIASNWNIANISTGWNIAGTGDFNGDIRADILWRDTAGNVAIWLMDGPNISSFSAMGNVADRMAQ